MRHLFIKSLAGAALLTIVGAVTANAQIANSSHDLDAVANGGNGTDGVCTYCHTPHKAASTDVALWNRNDSLATFTMYSSVTLDNAIGAAPGPVSMACLSCHDGVTAFNSIVNGTAPSNAGTMGVIDKAVGAGGNLADDHPVSVAYNTVDTQFNAAAGGFVNSVLPLYGATNNDVECATCHSVHEPGTELKFLRVAKAGSLICTTCHTK